MTQVGLADATSWRTVFFATAVFSAVTFVVLGLLYRSPATPAGPAPGMRGVNLSMREIVLLVFAGLIWTFVNAGWVVVVSFAPEYLRTQGMEIGRAAAVASLATWVGVIGVPLGGYLASKWRRPDTLVIASMAISGLAILAIPNTTAYVLCFTVIGLMLFLPAGIIAALPIEVLRPETRALGLGLFYTTWYAGMAALPPVGGWTYDVTGSAAAPIFYAAALVFLTLAALLAFRLVQRTPVAATLVR
jgi:predicted MFS family arabinose efflux permease